MSCLLVIQARRLDAMSSVQHPRSIMTKPSWRRHMIRVSVCLAAYAATLVPVALAFRYGVLPGKPWLYLVAASPIVPVAGLVIVVLRYLHEEEDEYLRT